MSLELATESELAVVCKKSGVLVITCMKFSIPKDEQRSL